MFMSPFLHEIKMHLKVKCGNTAQLVLDPHAKRQFKYKPQDGKRQLIIY